MVADVDQGLSLGWGLGGQAAQALTSINGIVVTHIQRDDLLVLDHQMKTKAQAIGCSDPARWAFGVEHVIQAVHVGLCGFLHGAASAHVSAALGQGRL